MNNLWIDVTDFITSYGNFTGIQRVQYEIVRGMKDKLKNKVKFLIYRDSKSKFYELKLELNTFVEDGLIVEVNEKLFYKHTAKFINNDVVLIMSGIWYDTFIDDLKRMKQKRNFKVVTLVHDIIPVTQPQFFVGSFPETFTESRVRLFKITDGYLTISQYSNNEIKEFFKSNQIKAIPSKVIRIGDEIKNIKAVDALGINKHRPFILSVGLFNIRKNPWLIYYAYKFLLQNNYEIPKLVVVGGQGAKSQDFIDTLYKDPLLKDCVIKLDGVSDSQLAWLYQNCLFTVYPSFYEGWGMPIAESLNYGKLCLISNASSMEEIATDLTVSFSPYDSVKFAKLIAKYTNPQALKPKEERIKMIFKPTSWDSTCLQVLNFIKEDIFKLLI